MYAVIGQYRLILVKLTQHEEEFTKLFFIFLSFIQLPRCMILMKTQWEVSAWVVFGFYYSFSFYSLIVIFNYLYKYLSEINYNSPILICLMCDMFALLSGQIAHITIIINFVGTTAEQRVLPNPRGEISPKIVSGVFCSFCFV